MSSRRWLTEFSERMRGMSSNATAVSGPKRACLYLTADEFNDLSDEFRASPLAEGHPDTYESNSPMAEYIRRLLEEPIEVDMSDYEATPPSSREYSRSITILFPTNQYQDLREKFAQTPLYNDKNARGTYAGNSAFGEYLRRYLRHHLNEGE